MLLLQGTQLSCWLLLLLARSLVSSAFLWLWRGINFRKHHELCTRSLNQMNTWHLECYLHVLIGWRCEEIDAPAREKYILLPPQLSYIASVFSLVGACFHFISHMDFIVWALKKRRSWHGCSFIDYFYTADCCYTWFQCGVELAFNHNLLNDSLVNLKKKKEKKVSIKKHTGAANFLILGTSPFPIVISYLAILNIIITLVVQYKKLYSKTSVALFTIRWHVIDCQQCSFIDKG